MMIYWKSSLLILNGFSIVNWVGVYWMKNNNNNFKNRSSSHIASLAMPFSAMDSTSSHISRESQFHVSQRVPISTLWHLFRNPPEVNHLLQRHNPMCEAFPRVSSTVSFVRFCTMHSCWPVFPLTPLKLAKRKQFLKYLINWVLKNLKILQQQKLQNLTIWQNKYLISAH